MFDRKPYVASVRAGGFAPRARTDEACDEDVVRRTLAGERNAFEILVRRYERPIFAHLLRMTGRPEDAEDLTQETFLKAFRGLDGYRSDRPFRPWLYRIATNTALSALRRRGPSVVSLDDEHTPSDSLADPRSESASERLEREELLERLGRAIEKLPAEAAALINLRYHEEMSFAEIGAALGRRTNTVVVTLHRLRQRLRELVLDDERRQRKGDQP